MHYFQQIPAYGAIFPAETPGILQKLGQTNRILTVDFFCDARQSVFSVGVMVEQIQKRERCYQVSVTSCVGLEMSDLLFYEVQGLWSGKVRQNIFVRT